MNKKEIKHFVDKQKWYYYYNFDGVEVSVDLKNKKDHGLNNWKKINPIIKKIFRKYDCPKVLDIGCNMGLYAYEMEKMGAEVVGIDKKIDQALFFKKYLIESKNKKTNILFRELDITKEGLLGETFNVITVFCVLYHLFPFENEVVQNFPMHDYLIVQGNTRRTFNKRKNKPGQHLAGISGMKNFLIFNNYSVSVYLENYSKPIVVGFKNSHF